MLALLCLSKKHAFNFKKNETDNSTGFRDYPDLPGICVFTKIEPEFEIEEFEPKGSPVGN